MKKRLFVLTAVLSACTLQSCQDDFDIPMPAARSYREDVEILNEFTDINRYTHRFYINPDRRSSILSYLTNADTRELNSVNSLNLDNFRQSIERINRLSEGFASSHGADYIVMITKNEICINPTNTSSPVLLNRAPSASSDPYPVISSLRIANQTESCNITGTHFGLTIHLNPESYKNAGWAFLLTCKSGNSRTATCRILFCGIGHHLHPEFEMTTLQDSYPDWTFEVIGLDDNAHMADVEVKRLHANKRKLL